MKFLLDANVRRSVGVFLSELGHDVRYIAGTADHSKTDQEVFQIASWDGRMLVTNDKEFASLIYYQGREHPGTILFRILDEHAEAYTVRLQQLLNLDPRTYQGKLVVITDQHIRIR